ncbi:MAG: enoyl-CoA hydratase-related protein [Chloroflexi bacterium]|nr:enoyl-CoA hydratase-related protein [Chloroflexota bacterium]
MDRVIELKKTGAVLEVALNRPLSHNALTPEMVTGLTAVFQDVNDRDDIRVVVLTGNGRSFCAGADLSFMQAAGDSGFEENVADGRVIFDLMLALDSCQKPVVGRVNGAAMGGGVGLVACCDIVVAVDRAHFAFSEARLGILPAVISPFVLAKIGAGNGRELFLTGERFSAERAREIGLVQHVVAEEALSEKVAERVAALLQAAPGAQAAGKALIRAVVGQEKIGRS